MIDSGSKGCPEQESAGCHFGTLGRNFLRAKTKWPPNISRSNMIFQQMKPGTSVIPHFHVILTGQSISCIILMTQGHLQGQKDNFKVKEAKTQFLTNKDRNPESWFASVTATSDRYLPSLTWIPQLTQ